MVSRSIITKKPYSSYSIIFCIFYGFFVFKRYKYFGGLLVDGLNASNYVILLILVLLFNIVVYKEKRIPRIPSIIIFILFLYSLSVLFFKGQINRQTIFALLTFILPMNFYVLGFLISHNELKSFLKAMLFLSFFYSIFFILASIFLPFFYSIIGLALNFEESNYRVSTMFGSSVSLAYAFNLLLCVCYYFAFSSNFSRRIRNFAFLSIILNILATLLSLTRSAVVYSIIISLFWLFRYGLFHNRNILKIILLVVSSIISILIMSENFDLSRLTINFSQGGLDASSISRFDAMKFGLHIYSKFPVVGSGLGYVYKRIYSNKFVTFNGSSSLIDPHSGIILLLSELGVIGVSLFTSLNIWIVKRINAQFKKSIRTLGYSLFISTYIVFIFGSELINLPEYSVLCWSLLGALSRRKNDN